MRVYIHTEKGSLHLAGSAICVGIYRFRGATIWSASPYRTLGDTWAQAPVPEGVIPKELQRLIAEAGGSDGVMYLRNWLAANSDALAEIYDAVHDAYKKFTQE